MKSNRLVKILLVSLALVVLILAGGYVGRRQYVSMRQTKLLNQARHAMGKSDTRRAGLLLQRAVKANPKDVEACRLMAQLSEAVRSPGALLWRSRVVEMNSNSVPDRLALARSALAAREILIATNALQGIPESGRHTPEFHNVAGTAATLANQFPDAELHFAEAARLDPTNPVPQLNLAVVRLQRTNTQAQAEARAQLRRLCDSPPMRAQALRELAVDAMRRRQTNDALALTADLVRLTNSLFSDRILRLEVLRAGAPAQFAPALSAFQREAGADPGKIYELAMWHIQKFGATNTMPWLRTLPPAVVTNQPVALLMAQCLSAMHDWRPLKDALSVQTWGELEFIRRAFLARALREQDLLAAAKSEWQGATKGTGGRKEGLIMLLRMAAQWNWATESEELLWMIVNNSPGEKWAVPALSQALMAGGRTRSLMGLYSQQSKLAPDNLALKNNLAMTALLLDAQEMRPHLLARQIFDAAPTNAVFVSTYAWSLHIQDKTDEALRVFERLNPKELQDPAIATYYGLILQASGAKAKARPYLELAAKARLLPEEQKLVDRARASL